MIMMILTLSNRINQNIISKVNESPPPYSDTSHEILPDVVMVNRNISSQIGGSSRTNENSAISIISIASSTKDINNEDNSQCDNKDDKSVHM